MAAELIIWSAEVFLWWSVLWAVASGSSHGGRCSQRERESQRGRGEVEERESGLRFGEAVRYMFWGHALD